jgi:predicted DCC family thiol-disulfide oxidoreductase YuxK
MKTLRQHVLLYDQDCPMCRAYSAGFVKAGLLDQEGRMVYEHRTPAIDRLIDPVRSRNEIALVNLADQRVLYGIDSLIEIVGHRFAFLKKVLTFAPVYWLLQKFYAFISYNRKVVAPAQVLNAPGSCTPDYNLFYRILFIIVASISSILLVHRYFENNIFFQPAFQGIAYEACWFAGQLALQTMLVALLKKDRVVEYMGHNAVVSLIGALLLLPAIWLSDTLNGISPYLYAGWLAAVVLFMLWQHQWRLKILGLPGILTFSWLAIRLLMGYLSLPLSYTF